MSPRDFRPLAFSRHNRASDPVGRGLARFVSCRRFNQDPEPGTLIFAFAGIRSGLWFSLNTHRELFAGAAGEHEAAWPIGLALATLAGVTVFVALVSEVFVGSVQYAATAFGMSPAFVGFIVVALVGAAAEMAAAFSAAQKSSRFEREHCTR